TFTQTGLFPGTSWSITLEGSSRRSAGTTITYYEPNGTYGYAVASVPGYTVLPASGSVTVNGASRNVAISFTANTVGGTLVVTIPVGSAPLDVAYDSGNGYVYVANLG